MSPFRFPTPPPRRAARRQAWLTLAWLGLPLAGLAQGVCSSDGQVPPRGLLERFMGADCETCWQQAPLAPAAGLLALDWIVPSVLGDDAPLSAAASRDALLRLDALDSGRPPPGRSLQRQQPVARAFALGQRAQRAAAPDRMRVAMGPALGGYVGTSVSLKQPLGPPPWTVWLALVEELEAGIEGSPVPRRLVRNLLVLERDAAGTASAKLSKKKQTLENLSGPSSHFIHETRSMAVPPGAQPERLRLVGWQQDGQGRITILRAAVCPPAGEKP